MDTAIGSASASAAAAAVTRSTDTAYDTPDAVSSVLAEQVEAQLLEEQLHQLHVNALSLTTQLYKQRMSRRSATLPPRIQVLEHVQKYAYADERHVAVYLGATLVLYAMLSQGWRLYDDNVRSTSTIAGNWPCYLCCLLFGLLKIRLFVLFHDCGHYSFVASRRGNVAIGTILGALLYTPFMSWSAAHREHHRHSNNLDFSQEFAQTSPWTVDMYENATVWERVYYKVVFGPLTHFTVLPVFAMVVLQRLSSLWYENILAALTGCVWVAFGWRAVCYEATAAVIVGSLGYMLFHIQHTFEDSYKSVDGRWSFYENAMLGCSFLQVPRWLRFFTAGIEYHHIHHLNTKVPCYHLAACHDAARWSCTETFCFGDDDDDESDSTSDDSDATCDDSVNGARGVRRRKTTSTSNVASSSPTSSASPTLERCDGNAQLHRQHGNDAQAVPHYHSLFACVAHIDVRHFLRSLRFSLYNEQTQRYDSVYDY